MSDTLPNGLATPMSDAEIAELRAALDAMTPGEWCEDGKAAVLRVNPHLPHDHLIIDRGMTDSNRRGIVLLRNRAGALLSALAAARQRIAELEDELRIASIRANAEADGLEEWMAAAISAREQALEEAAKVAEEPMFGLQPVTSVGLHAKIAASIRGLKGENQS